jgi:hypothetical protein
MDYNNDDDERMKFETKNCIMCHKEATSWCGHVIKENREIILAGWCDGHEYIPRKSDTGNYGGKYGCYGGWMKEYGLLDMDQEETTDDPFLIGELLKI